MADDDGESSENLPVKEDQLESKADFNKVTEDAGSPTTSAQKLEPENEVRDYLVTTAVHFLQNPKVRNSPIYQKKAFLLKKGLTEEEISIAITRAGIDTLTQPQHPHALTIAPINEVPVQVPISSTLWSWWKDITYAIIILGSSLYGVYCFYKDYLEPRWFGKSSKSVKHQVLSFEDHLQDVNLSLSNLRESLACVESSLLEQDKKIQKLLVEVSSREQTTHQDSVTLAEMKSELASIKALLLGRRQFPSNPIVGIPSWQLNGDMKLEDTMSKEQMEGSEEKKEDGDEPILHDTQITGSNTVEVSSGDTKSTANGETSVYDDTTLCTT